MATVPNLSMSKAQLACVAVEAYLYGASSSRYQQYFEALRAILFRIVQCLSRTYGLAAVVRRYGTNIACP